MRISVARGPLTPNKRNSSEKPLPFVGGLLMVRAMHPDVEKLVESGRIPAAVGERLSQLAPGSFCLHKSWGSGKVSGWDLFAGKVTIDFEKEPGRVMGLKLALEKTESIESTDFRAHKIDQNAELKELAQSDPAAVVIRTLESHNGSMKPDQIDRQLCGSVVPEEAYKKWWDRAKKALRETRKVVVPSKRNEPLVLRDSDLSPLEILLQDFEEARDLRVKASVLEELRKDAKQLKQLAELVAARTPSLFLQYGEEIDLYDLFLGDCSGFHVDRKGRTEIEATKQWYVQRLQQTIRIQKGTLDWGVAQNRAWTKADLEPIKKVHAQLDQMAARLAR